MVTIGISDRPALPGEGTGSARLRQARALAAVRIIFGVIWLIDAGMKWSPQFTSSLVNDVSGQKPGQPAVVKSWLGWWVTLLGHQPGVFAYVIAVSESLLAISLIFGAFTNLGCIGGAVLSLLIWSTAEGFGGPYNAGSTDIGTSIIYVVVFAAILASGAGGWASVDQRLQGRFGRFCARPPEGLPSPSRAFLGLSALLVAVGLALGLIVAFVDAPMKAGMIM